MKEEKEFIKILIDDIIINKQVSDIPIDSRICDLFAENAFLTELKELDGSNVVNPIRCFLCRNFEQYKNVFYEDKKNEISLIQDKIFHPEFDYLYIFTDSPLVSENQSNIKSFALFVDRNIPIITESEEDIDKVKENIDDYNIIYFTKDAQKYYGVRDKSYFEELFKYIHFLIIYLNQIITFSRNCINNIRFQEFIHMFVRYFIIYIFFNFFW